MFKQIFTRVVGISLLTGLFIATGCQRTSTVTWQDNGMPYHVHPDQCWWNYQYVYYPNAQVYFEPYTKRFFWFENGIWRSDQQPPSELELNPEQARVVKLQNGVPFPQHDTVLVWYPCARPLPARFDAANWEESPVRMATEPASH